MKKSINDIIDEKNVNYNDIFSGAAQDQTRIYKDSFYYNEQSVFEGPYSKSIAVLNNSQSKKVHIKSKSRILC